MEANQLENFLKRKKEDESIEEHKDSTKDQKIRSAFQKYSQIYSYWSLQENLAKVREFHQKDESEIEKGIKYKGTFERIINKEEILNKLENWKKKLRCNFRLWGKTSTYMWSTKLYKSLEKKKKLTLETSTYWEIHFPSECFKVYSLPQTV